MRGNSILCPILETAWPCARVSFDHHGDITGWCPWGLRPWFSQQPPYLSSTQRSSCTCFGESPTTLECGLITSPTAQKYSQQVYGQTACVFHLSILRLSLALGQPSLLLRGHRFLSMMLQTPMFNTRAWGRLFLL